LKPEKNGYIFENQQRNGYILGRSNGDLIWEQYKTAFLKLQNTEAHTSREASSIVRM
jgi:hypothetical protein